MMEAEYEHVRNGKGVFAEGGSPWVEYDFRIFSVYFVRAHARFGMRETTGETSEWYGSSQTSFRREGRGSCSFQATALQDLQDAF